MKVLKKRIQNLPPLQIPSEGKQILQTKVDDNYWSIVLLEEIDRKRYIREHKSGGFLILYLAVKYGIKKI